MGRPLHRPGHRPEPRQAHWRASDAEREQVAAQVGQAMIEGRLSCSELEDRLAAVYAAKTFGELDPLTADLPFPGSGTVPQSTETRPANYCRGVGERQVNTMAVLSFVFAFAFFPLGPVFGLVARRQIMRSGEEGLALALAGLLISVVHLLSVVGAVILIVGLPGHSLPLH